VDINRKWFDICRFFPDFYPLKDCDKMLIIDGKIYVFDKKENMYAMFNNSFSKCNHNLAPDKKTVQMPNGKYVDISKDDAYNSSGRSYYILKQ
jgi:hypothetical protein